MADEYCDLCDLPLSQCIHGMPPPAEKPAARPPRTSPATTRRPTVTRSAPSAPAAPARPVQRKWTPPDALRPHVLAALQDAGGELDQADALAEIEARVGESLLAGDRERTPEGELRWHYAARRARQALLAEGLMAKARPGVWQLTDAGRRA